jgi:hydrogenase/urease accessory protein HupE
MFKIYLELGFTHILDLAAYDHLLFIISLFAIFTLKEWKHAFWLVTAFTVGHSITLILAALDKVVFPFDIIEFLIPLTILLTSLHNLWFAYKNKLEAKSKKNAQYIMASCFGLIHGSGFSNQFKSILMPDEGKKELIIQLLGFNVGIEVAQIAIVLVLIVLASLIQNTLKFSKKSWVITLSIIAAIISLNLLWETKFW